MVQGLFSTLAIGDVLNLEDEVRRLSMSFFRERSAPQTPDLLSRLAKVTFLHLTGGNSTPEQIREACKGGAEITVNS